MTDPSTVVWNDGISVDNYDGAGERYQNAILEQYKLYVEMMDKISARRVLVNTFFLTLNGAVVTTIGVFWRDPPDGSPWLLLVFLVVVLAQCLAWQQLLTLYRDLVSAKLTVIGALEARLPASPYFMGESAILRTSNTRWRGGLGGPSKWRMYGPAIDWEKWIPALFASTYLGAFILVVLFA